MASLNTLYKNFIDKNEGDTVSGVKTFAFNPTYINNTLNLVSNPFIGLASINFNNLSGSVLSSLRLNQSSQSINIDTSSQVLTVRKNGSSIININESIMTIPTSINLTYTTIPTLTPYHVGFNYGASTTSYTGNKSTYGTHFAYHSLNSVPLPVGKYLITINAAVSGVSSAVWTVNPFRVGYTLGTTSTPWNNTQFPLLATTTIYFNGTNANYQFNVCAVVSITEDNSYLSAYTSNTLPSGQTLPSGSVQSGISSYYVVRIA